MPTWSIGDAWVLFVVRVDEREAKRLEQRTAFVIGLCGSNDRDVESTNAVNLVLVDLVEHGLLREAERVVTVAVELLGAQAAEVTDARKRKRDQTVEEFPCTVATKCDVRADGLSFAKLELRDGLARELPEASGR